MHAFAVWSLFAGSWCYAPVLPVEPPPGIEFTPTKTEYLEGEPIEFQLRLVNRANVPIETDFSYPVRKYLGYPKFNITPVDCKLRPRINPEYPDGDEPTSYAVCGCVTQRVHVSPNESWSLPYYLQRWFNQPPPGEYKVKVKIKLYFTFHLSDKDHIRSSATLERECGFTILPGDEKKMAGVIETFARKLKSKDEWEQAAAKEALRTAETDLAIPHLVKLAKSNGYYAICALAKFPRSKEARETVQECFESDGAVEVPAAILVLAQWREKIDVKRFEELAKVREVLTMYAVDAYIRWMKDDTYTRIYKKSRGED